MFAAIYIPNFCLQAAVRSSSRDVGAAVLVEGDAVKGVVLEVNYAAHHAGVAPGMPSAQAMARCATLIFKIRSPSAEKAATDALLQTASGFSPNIENTAPGVCTIDLKGLGFHAADVAPGLPYSPATCENAPQSDALDLFPSSRVQAGDAANPRSAAQQQSFAFLEQIPTLPVASRPPSPLQAWANSVLTVLGSLRLHAQIGIAATPALALLAARAPQPITIVEHTRAFIASLPLEALDPTPEMLALLHRWGIQQVGQLIALGKDAIAERLGADALELFERASIHTIRPLDIVIPPDTFEEQIDFEAPLETLEPLLFVLRRFVEQLATRISLGYRVVAAIELRLSLESGAHYERAFSVPAPTSHVDTLFRMLHTHLENVRTDSPITSLRLAATPCRTQTQQFGLFESALRDPNQFHETLARLGALLGADRVGTPVVEQTYRPDAFQMRRPEFDTNPGHPGINRRGTSTGLALRRFRPAIDADVDTDRGQPVFVRTLMLTSAVRRARGPWIGSGDWWDQRRWSRNEWDVELRDGAIYRLYCANNRWFVEGVYD